ncbi:MAG TPA: hypothetical protein VFB23_09725 [Candidatus Acidoferrales bacterium]|nr:hypothetical protein [Candidatus Acidoferrales bacterium]
MDRHCHSAIEVFSGRASLLRFRYDRVFVRVDDLKLHATLRQPIEDREDSKPATDLDRRMEPSVKLPKLGCDELLNVCHNRVRLDHHGRLFRLPMDQPDSTW